MILRNTLLWRNVTEHVGLLNIIAPHFIESPLVDRPANSMYEYPRSGLLDNSIFKEPFSAAC
jgi:hypothetical protein